MDNIIELRRKRETYLDTAKSIIAKAAAEGRGLTVDEDKDVRGLKDKAETISATLKHADELRDLTADRGSNSRSGSPFLGTQQQRSGSGPFETLGEQIRSVVESSRDGAKIDPKLYEVRAATGLSEGVPSDGGFLVQHDFSTSLLQEGMTQAILAPRCKPFPIGANSNSVILPAVDETSRANGSRFGGVQLYWAGEADAITASKPKFRSMELKLKKLTGLCYLTDELVQDTTALEAFVRSAFASEFGFVIDDMIVRGTGVGQPLGILNSGCLVTVAKEVGQAADTIVTENILKMYSRLPASSEPTAVWFYNKSAFPQLCSMTITAGTSGQAIFMPAGGVSGKPYNTLLGLPLIAIEQAAPLGDKGDIVLADFSKYLLAAKGGLQVAMSIHVRFVNDEPVLRFIYRVDGQPQYASALTPYQGSDTQSPFVTLAAR